ncbi:GUN4 domain-containing protein [Trichocoleus sp. FACHB-90]|uniref:GUN4 domain-containing protein n=1 Tax=Cyanophyceae TaxID=3028117 RepID=UPI00168663C3|nr:GUN4 domain-containing protein [Trichocoleus sp. FACHB-90]MBD1929504.1 GUN4 domain-containing protein [Trichocoleus sp. FACHB-90]
MSNIIKQWLYYIIGILLVALGAMIAGILLVWSFPIPGLIVGGILVGIGSYLCFLSDKLRKRRIRIHFPEDRLDAKNRNVSMDGGTYNEQIQGDSINIQGNQIYLGSDLSEFTNQIKEILHQLQNQGCDAVAAQEQVIDELKIQIPKNSRIRTKLLKWKKQLGISTSNRPNDRDLAERVVNFAAEKSSNFFGNSDFRVEGKYKRLHDLLEAEKWEEADEETVKVICRLMPDRSYRYIDVYQIPPKDIKRINQLWVKFSNGRFGLSVQQNIWRRILKDYNANENRFWIDDSVYKVFIDRVGWPRENNRIYHSDIEYSLKAPRGHLPAILMFEDYWYSGYSSNYCDFNKFFFKKLMEREYYRIPFIPSWLENWLFIE